MLVFHFSSAKKALPAAILLCLAGQGAHASGFQLKEDDAAGLGRAYAGSTSAPDERLSWSTTLPR